MPTNGLGLSGQTIEGVGIAGTPLGGVVTVQGDAGTTPLPVSGTVSVAKQTTYGASGRANARVYDLSHVFAAAGRFQYVTLYHPASSLITARIKQVTAQLISVSAAAHVTIDLSRLNATTAPATGSPTITPQAANGGSGLADTTVLGRPTTQGIEVNPIFPIASLNANLGITGAASVASPPPFGVANLWPLVGAPNIEADDPTIRAGFAEGWAIVVDVSAACTLNATFQVVFTEE